MDGLAANTGENMLAWERWVDRVSRFWWPAGWAAVVAGMGLLSITANRNGTFAFLLSVVAISAFVAGFGTIGLRFWFKLHLAQNAKRP
jgi:hypothetical protein